MADPVEEKAYIVHAKILQFILDGICEERPDDIQELEIAFKLEADE
tara:strand:+ start:514 stop:651 length:138 start_codon:yes stop_codon:yes gene_type:complete